MKQFEARIHDRGYIRRTGNLRVSTRYLIGTRSIKVIDIFYITFSLFFLKKKRSSNDEMHNE